MDELLILMILAVAGLVFIGPLIAVIVHAVRIRGLEADLRQLRRVVEQFSNQNPARTHREASLGGLAEKIRQDRDSVHVRPEAVEASLSVAESVSGSDHELVHADLSEDVPEKLEQDGSIKPQPKSDARVVDAPLWGEFPPYSEKVATTQADAANATELLIVRVMTWAGVITLVLGVGFLYRYALAQGWISDTGRVIGGLVVGCIGFAAAVFGRRKDYVFFADCLAAASSGVIKLSIYSATVWYGMISAGTGFRGFLIGGAALWAYAVFYRSRLAASLATVAALLTPALLPDYAGPTAEASTMVFACYLLVVNLTVVAVSTVRAWRLPAAIATVGTGIHLVVWYQQVFEPGREVEALAWLAGFAVLFLGHAVVPALRTHEEHPLDSPMLVGGATYLMFAVLAVTLPAEFLPRVASPTLLAAIYVSTWLGLRQRLPGFIPEVLGATTAFLVAAAAPLWISPAWTLVTWAALAWLWAKIAIRDDRKIAAMIATIAFAFVQIMTAVLTLVTIGDANAMPVSGFDWTLTGSVVGQLEEMFRRVPVGETSVFGMIFHSRSISLFACGVTAFLILRDVQKVGSLPRIGVNATTLRRVLGMLAVVNLVGISFAEFTHAAVRGDWKFSLGASVWTLHFAVLAATCCWWSLRNRDDTSRAKIAGNLLRVVAMSAGCVTLAVIGEALDNKSSDVLLPLLSPRSVVMLGSLASVAGLSRWLATAADDEVALKLRKLASVVAITTFAFIVTNETIQFGAWMKLSATEVSALLTGILGVIGVVLMAAGFLKQDVGCRRAGLALLSVATLKVYLIDVWSSSSEVRTVAFLILGATLLGAALLYRRYRDQFAEWLGEKNDVLR